MNLLIIIYYLLVCLFFVRKYVPKIEPIRIIFDCEMRHCNGEPKFDTENILVLFITEYIYVCLLFFQVFSLSF